MPWPSISIYCIPPCSVLIVHLQHQQMAYTLGQVHLTIFWSQALSLRSRSMCIILYGMFSLNSFESGEPGLLSASGSAYIVYFNAYNNTCFTFWQSCCFDSLRVAVMLNLYIGPSFRLLWFSIECCLKSPSVSEANGANTYVMQTLTTVSKHLTLLIWGIIARLAAFE